MRNEAVLAKKPCPLKTAMLIYSHIQEERIHFVYQCGARRIGFERVKALVA